MSMNDAMALTIHRHARPCAGHPRLYTPRHQDVDGWDKPGHDGDEAAMTIEPERDGGERIARAIARAGLASRREAEAWIAAGRVAVNGEVIHSPARDVTARDRITVDGEPLPAKQRTRLFLYHKPRGLLTTHADPRGRPNIFARLPRHLPRLISVGRLDFNTEGLLLLTNDGALARVLELPATGWLRRYRVRAHGSVTQPELDALRDGISVEGVQYGPVEAALDRVQGSNLWLTFAIREGKNREVRNVLGALGLTVTRLIRVSFGPFQLGELAEGEVEEVRTRVLREQLGPRVVAQAGADFSAQLPPSPPPRREDNRQDKREDKRKKKPLSHSWRAPDGEQQKPLRRSFHGARGDKRAEHVPPGAVRADAVTDRKGRRVAVERHGERKPIEVPPQKPHAGKDGRKHRRGRRISPDRASGPRSSHRRRGR
jgi:23S rRNA pseudouridine2605 synthase